jgi:hypothetical protein
MKTILRAFREDHLRSLQTLALCSNGAARLYRVIRSDMFDTCTEALVSSARQWATEIPRNVGLQVFAEGEVLSCVKTQLSIPGTPTLTVNFIVSRTNEIFLEILIQNELDKP